MSSRLTTDMMNKMDSILDRELEFLGHSKRSSACYDKQSNTGLLSSVDTYKGTSSITYHSRKSSNCGERSSRVAFKDIQQLNGDGKVDHSYKMQKELLALQAKVLELEMKISSMPNTTTNKKNSQASIFSSSVDSSKIASLYATPSARTNEPDAKSSLRPTVDYTRKISSNLRASPILHEDQMELSRSTPEEYSKVLVRCPSGISTQATNKSTIKKSLKRNSSNRYKHSISGETSHSTSRNISLSLTNNSFKRKAHQEFEDEHFFLRKQIKTLKTEYDNDRAALIKERVKGKELNEEIQKLMKKMNRLEASLGTAAKVQGSYQDLMESFGKSEDIRKQQRNLIERLNNDLRLLKGEDDFPQKEKLSASRARVAVNKHLRNKSSKRAMKAF